MFLIVCFNGGNFKKNCFRYMQIIWNYLNSYHYLCQYMYFFDEHNLMQSHSLYNFAK